jgi:hypothetical protein
MRVVVITVSMIVRMVVRLILAQISVYGGLIGWRRKRKTAAA